MPKDPTQSERLARIETLLDNHVLTELKRLSDAIDGVNNRVWTMLASIIFAIALEIVLRVWR